MKKLPSKDPAIRSYFFGKGYKDLRLTITDSWRLNLDSVKKFFDKAPDGDEFFDVIQKGVYWAAAISTLVFGTLFFLVASTFHVAFLSLLFLAIYIGFSLLWTFERGYLAIRSFFVACPHCHHKALLPEYFCDDCGAIHAQLLPNTCGILHHHCLCGNKLPSTLFLNRGRLKARCPSCHEGIAREHVESQRIFVPVMGGPSVGKSAFLFSSIQRMIEQKETDVNFSAEPFDPVSKRVYRDVVNALEAGLPPEKTIEMMPRAFNLALRKKGRLEFLLYLYDPAGEAYQDANQLTFHGYNNYSSGMIFIIDPFSIPAVNKRYKTQLSSHHNDVRPSELPIGDALERLIVTLEADFGLSKKGKIKKPLAIVFSKTDAFDIGSLIGEAAVEDIFKNWEGLNPPKLQDVRNKLLKEKLIEWEERAFVNTVEKRFSNVCYFPSASLNRSKTSGTGGKAFAASGVLSPLMWICSYVSESDFQRHD